MTAGNGKPFTKGARKNGVQGRFLDYARNDGTGDSIDEQTRNGASRRPVTSSRANPRDLSCTLVQRRMCDSGNGNPSAKEARKNGVQGGFLDCARNDGRRNDVYHEFEKSNK